MKENTRKNDVRVINTFLAECLKWNINTSLKKRGGGVHFEIDGLQHVSKKLGLGVTEG